MKTILVLIALTVGIQAGAATKKKPAPKTDARTRICQALIAKAEASCDESMCEQDKEASGDDNFECVHDGDFNEGLQICVYDNELPDAIKDWNKKHKFQIENCDDVND